VVAVEDDDDDECDDDEEDEEDHRTAAAAGGSSMAVMDVAILGDFAVVIRMAWLLLQQAGRCHCFIQQCRHCRIDVMMVSTRRSFVLPLSQPASTTTTTNTLLNQQYIHSHSFRLLSFFCVYLSADCFTFSIVVVVAIVTLLDRLVTVGLDAVAIVVDDIPVRVPLARLEWRQVFPTKTGRVPPVRSVWQQRRGRPRRQ
jgi:hypothetical protein